MEETEVKEYLLSKKFQNRFWSKVDKTEYCWNWKASKSSGGYGQIMLKRNGKSKLLRAHRCSYYIFYKQLETKMFVCHSCDNPSCINPKHLFLGTAKDNAQDMARKNRVKNMNMIKTFCKRGHLLNGINLYITPDKRRQCKECIKLRKKIWREKCQN